MTFYKKEDRKCRDDDDIAPALNDGGTLCRIDPAIHLPFSNLPVLSLSLHSVQPLPLFVCVFDVQKSTTLGTGGVDDISNVVPKGSTAARLCTSWKSGDASVELSSSPRAS